MRTFGLLAILSVSSLVQDGKAPPAARPAQRPPVAAAPQAVEGPAPERTGARILTAGPKIVLEAGDHFVRDLVAASCAVLHRNELAHWPENPQSEQARIHLATPMEVDPKDWERVVAGLMYTCKYVLTPVDPANGLWEWIYLLGPSKAEVRRRAQFMAAEELRDYKGPLRFVTLIYPLKNLDPQRAANSLRPMFGQDLALGLDPITPIGSSRAVAITHYSDIAAAILRLLEVADRNAPPPEETSALDQIRQLTERVQALEKKLAAGTQPPGGK